MPETTETETTEETPSEATGAPEDDAQEPQEPTEPTGDQEPDDTEEEPESFPRDYVQKLRDENARYRQRAQKSDEYAHRLHRALVDADGRLADPTDLDYDAEHLDDAQALTAAIDELLARKPHLGSRKPRGDIGQGAVTPSGSAVDLAGLLRAGAS